MEVRVTAWTTPLRPGLALSFDGEQFTVAEIEGRRILLQPAAAVVGVPKWRQVDISVLLAHPTTEILVPVPQEEPSAAAVLGGLDGDGDAELTRRFRHVQEVMTGYQLGDEVLALPGEPQSGYAPGTPMLHRYAAKAAELGVAESTIRNWVRQVKTSGPAGLVHERPKTSVLDRADSRWLEMARAVLKGHERSSRPVRNLVLMEIEERLGGSTGRARSLFGTHDGLRVAAGAVQGHERLRGQHERQAVDRQRPQGDLRPTAGDASG